MTQREEYLTRMQTAPQFSSRSGITPVWQPGKKDIEGFCHDEVVRQLHDPRIWEDGGKRVEQMLNAWSYAQTKALLSPTVEDILKLGALIEPEMNSTRSRPSGEFRHENVSIGGRLGVFPPYLDRAADLLIRRAGDVVPGTSKESLPYELMIEDFEAQSVQKIHTVDDWYLAYQWIHPFRDGNGRSGKILHNWLGGTLDDPVLVPDYFGGSNP